MIKIIFLLALLCPFVTLSQTGNISGTVSEALSGGGVPGAQIKLSNGTYAVTNEEGKYELNNVTYGQYTIQVMAFDLDTLTKVITVNKPSLLLDLKMGEATELEEVKITSNIIDRTTPIAVTQITAAKIQEELGSRDLPMILNATPGVYATQTGGGDGDSRITVRGFDQRNVGVLIDGVPVNDMENGTVYWSNWFGLDNITNQIQVQRGLGATKLSMPSVGGSLNIITSGAHNRKGFSFKQEFTTGNFLRSSLTYNSGILKNGWGFLASGSYKRADGWVEANYSKGYFFYFKVQKKMDKHLLSFSAFGAPQEHGQRSFNQRIQYWDSETARKLGATIDSTQQMDHGIRFNQHYGYLANGSGDSTQKNERINYYFKPQLTLKDLWILNKKTSISNIAYMSIGRGGGTRLANSGGTLYTTDGHLDWNGMYQANQVNSLFGTPTIDNQYSATELKSSQVMVSSLNNHFWVGYLGQVKYEYSSKLTLNGGIDYRYYKGTHYQKIYDIMGGDYFINGANKNQASPMYREGDKVALNTYSDYRDGIVQWGGVFGSAEYVSSRWSAFVNLSGVINAYKGRDYFQKKVLEVGDTTLRIGANDTVTYQGQTYTASSPGLKWFETDYKTIPGGTIKMGASYILNEQSNVFMNAGYLSRTPQFSNVIDNNTNSFFAEIKNEIIQAIEIGYTYAGKKFGANVNGYFTNWKNKPFPFGVAVPDPQDPTSSIYLNINGMDAIHKGVEVDLAYNITSKLSTEFMYSLGDWRWNSSETFYVPDYNYTFTFDAKGVHVGNSAQTMMNWSLRYEPFKRFYVKLQYQWFDRNYADFSPFSLQGANGGRDSWKMPSYGLVNAFIGYSVKFEKCNLFFNGSIVNMLNRAYISDATNNFYGTNFDAGSASVMFGPGFRFNTSVGVNF